MILNARQSIRSALQGLAGCMWFAWAVAVSAGNSGQPSTNSPPAQPPPTQPPLTPATVAAFFDTAMDVQRQDYAMVGAVVAVVHQGRLLFKRGYGWADLEQRVAADPNRSLFRIASISKTFVWTAIMQLSEQGRLDLNDEANKHLDFSLPASFAEPIRIKHLMAHTAGFEELNTGTFARTALEITPLGEYLSTAIPAQVRAPGQQAAYSNYGAAVAGYIVQRVTGQSWSDYVDQNILQPLGMNSTNTHHNLSADFASRHATSYSYRAGIFEAMPYQFFNLSPAGSMSTTADDMGRYMLAHLDLGKYQGSRILQQATARKMRGPLFDPHEAIAPILHGFFRTDRNGQIVFGHGGDVNQFHSNMALLPERQLGVFFSFNTDSSSAATPKLIAAFIDHFFPNDYLRPAPKPLAVDLDDYIGEYIALRNNYSTFERLTVLLDSLEITAQGSDLLLSSTRKSRWRPIAADRFTSLYSERALLFERDDAGRVTRMMFGSPLSTYERVRGFDAPSNIVLLIVGAVIIALGALFGYGLRAIYPTGAAQQLPRRHLVVARLYALGSLGLYIQLATTLSGNVDEFAFGMPTATHINLWLINLSLLIGATVVYFSIRQWLGRLGGFWARARFSLLALAAIVNAWIAYYFNFIAYVFA